jgi:hypothetical protein
LFRGCAAAALLILTAADYKAFGTSKRFNAGRGRLGVEYEPLPGMNTTIYESLCQHPEYRSALDLTAPSPLELRHTGLTTPQGEDPFLPAQYKVLVDRIGLFRDNRAFDLRPEDEMSLRLLGVRYFISSEHGPLYSQLSLSRSFHLPQPDDNYYKVFEVVDPRPSFGWENGDQEVEVSAWQPERRGFIVRSGLGGRFRLTEQFYPGWNATVDGMEASIERCHEASSVSSFRPVDILSSSVTTRAGWSLVE